MRSYIKEYFTLTIEKIDALSAQIGQVLSQCGYARRDVLKIRLLVEEFLSAIYHSKDITRQCVFTMQKRFGNGEIMLAYDGLPFSPLKETDDEFRAILLEHLGVHCQWKYQNDTNFLSFAIKKKRKRTGAALFVSIAAAVLFGILSRWMSQPISDGLVEYVLQPFKQSYLGMLNGLSGILIFFHIILGLCGDQEAEPLGKESRYMLLRMPVAALCCCAVGYLLLGLFGGISFQVSAETGRLPLDQVLELLWGIIPNNVVTPFLEENLLQILFLAIVCGVTLSAVRDRFPELMGTISGISYVVTSITVKLCRLSPLFVFCSLFMLIRSPDAAATLHDIWKPMVMLLLLGSVMVAGVFAALGIRFHCRGRRVLRTLMPAFLICLTTGSPIAAYSTNVEILEKQLGVSKRFSRVGLSIGSKIYVPGTILYLAVMVIFFAQKYQVPVNAGWMVTAVLLTVLLALVCPPVPGGLLVIFGILSKQFGFPAECLSLLAAADVVLDGPATGLSCLLRNGELLFEAGSYQELEQTYLEKL